MVGKRRPRLATSLWAYVYLIVPAQPEDRLGTMIALLDQAHSDALRGSRIWVGKVVLEREDTRILVVSDSPDQKRSVNGLLEGELTALNARFSITVPVVVTDEADASPPTGRPEGRASDDV